MQKQKVDNNKIALILLIVVIGMVALTFASVPLYQLFCQVTGYGGTTQVAISASEKIIDRKIRVQFISQTHKDLDWSFTPDQKEVTVNIGENSLIYYTAENLSDEPLSGTAIYNVTPLKIGIYFQKVECFCFREQKLMPGEKVQMPVMFYIDPEIMNDKNMDEVTTITLSYTFFKMK